MKNSGTIIVIYTTNAQSLRNVKTVTNTISVTKDYID